MNWVVFSVIYIFILFCVWGIDIGVDAGWVYKIVLSILSGVVTYFIVLKASQE